MTDANTVPEDQIEWSVAEVAIDGTTDGDSQIEPVYVAMQPGSNDGQVEVQEVVIVTEGGEQIAEVQSYGDHAFDHKSGQVLTYISEEVIPDQHYVPVPIISSEHIPDDKKLLLQQLQRSDHPIRAPARSPRGRPGRPPRTKFLFGGQGRRPKIEPEEDDDFPAPVGILSTPQFPRSRGGKSLSKMTKIEPPIQSSSETDSDSEGEVRFRRIHHSLGPSVSKKKPKPRDFAHRLQWRNRDMLEAMKAVEESKMTIRGAAKKYNVPYSTLKDRIHGRVRHGAKPGVKTILSPEEEEELAKFVRDMENAGFQLRCIDVRDRAAELLRLNHGHNSPYKEGSPGHNWFHGFVKRHPGLEFKRTVKKNIVPSISKQKHMLRRFYDITANIYKKYKLSHKSDRIFSVSELRIGGHFEATILYAAAANGSLIPPFVIFKGNSLKLTSARQEYPEAFFTCSYDGRVNEDIFLWWFRDHFLKRVPTGHARPGILYVSRAVNDITIQTLQLAKEERMNLVGMTFGISHLVQPLDDDVSDMIRGAFNKRFTKWQDENPGVQVTQVIVAQILRKVWIKIDPEEIASKFTANGIYPLNAYAITQDKLLTGAHILREMVERSPPRPSGDSPPLSGLNLLSTLSSQEYASLDTRDYMGASNQSFETHSDISMNDSVRSDRERSDNQGYKVVIKSHPGKENEVMVVPMNESADEGSVVQEQVEVSADIVSSELVETEVISEPTEEQMQELMQTQRELKRKRPRPSTDILERNTDVQTEIIAARENEDQISKAIDSILEKEPVAVPSTSDIKLEKIESPAPPEPKRMKASTPLNIIKSPVQASVIAPDRIKEEISKAIRSSSFGGSSNAMKLSDFEGKDIKIQIRIQNPDESASKTQTPRITTISTPSTSSRIQRGSRNVMPKFATRAEATEAAMRKTGGFIKVSDPSRKRQNIVIQSSQIKAKTDDFSPIIQPVEAVGEELPSQILAMEEEQPNVSYVSGDTHITTQPQGIISAHRVPLAAKHHSPQKMVTSALYRNRATSSGISAANDEAEQGMVVITQSGEQFFTGEDGQEYVLASSGSYNTENITTITSESAAEEMTELITEDGERIMVSTHELVQDGDGGHILVEGESHNVPQHNEEQQCVVQYVNERGEIIEVKEVPMNG